MARRAAVLITCEHGGNRVPARFREWFRGHEDLLRTHRGYDPGALTMAHDLAQAFTAPLVVSTVSRLVIDLNRSVGHPRLYSEATRAAPPAARHEMLQRCYLPYREQVEQMIAEMTAHRWRVVHVSSHSFTPVLEGEVRNADIGLLYDPRRAGEKSLCAAWRAALKAAAPSLAVRLNYPYTGRSDGFTSYLRRRFGDDDYLGIELEINQRQVSGRGWPDLRGNLVESLRPAMGRIAPDRRAG